MPDFKLFTLQEAERTLPLVRRIVQDLTAARQAFEKYRLDDVTAGTSGNAGGDA